MEGVNWTFPLIIRCFIEVQTFLINYIVSPSAWSLYMHHPCHLIFFISSFILLLSLTCQYQKRSSWDNRSYLTLSYLFRKPHFRGVTITCVEIAWTATSSIIHIFECYKNPPRSLRAATKCHVNYHVNLKKKSLYR